MKVMGASEERIDTEKSLDWSMYSVVRLDLWRHTATAQGSPVTCMAALAIWPLYRPWESREETMYMP